MWYFERIPQEMRGQVIGLYEKNQYRELISIYNKYKVSPDPLKPCCSFEMIRLWTAWAIRENKIQADGLRENIDPVL